MHQLRDLRHQFDDQVIISLSGCHPSVLVFGISCLISSTVVYPVPFWECRSGVVPEHGN
jgi:hypothetical protein